MSRSYECIYILPPSISEEKTAEVIAGAARIITEGKGTVEELSKWGKRRLSHPLEKITEGVFYSQKFSSGAEALPALNKALRLNESVLNFMITRVVEHQDRK